MCESDDDQMSESEDDDTSNSDSENGDENMNTNRNSCNHNSNHNCNCESSDHRLPLSDIGNKVKQRVPMFLPTELSQTNNSQPQRQTVGILPRSFIQSSDSYSSQNTFDACSVSE